MERSGLFTIKQVWTPTIHSVHLTIIPNIKEMMKYQTVGQDVCNSAVSVVI